MKKTLLFVLALAVIPVGVDAQVTELAQLRALAEQGDASAQYRLGQRYASVLGRSTTRSTPQDYAEAVRWYRLAAEQGYAPAQSSLGYMYTNGNGVPEDDAEAVCWFRLAAEQGDMYGQIYLGSMYAEGEGVPEDDVLAYMWYNLAAAQGLEAAQSGKDFLEQQMTREQIAEAQRLSREWLEAHPSSGN
jgi:TPR repeat protein